MARVAHPSLAERNAAFGALLRRLRTDRGMSLRQFAHQLELSTPYLSDVERGQRPPLVPQRLEAAARILGASLDELRQAALPMVCPACGARRDG